jgi:hypothetical protein
VSVKGPGGGVDRARAVSERRIADLRTQQHRQDGNDKYRYPHVPAADPSLHIHNPSFHRIEPLRLAYNRPGNPLQTPPDAKETV